MNTIQKWYDFVLQQMAAEGYMEGIDLNNDILVKQRLIRGNNRLNFPEEGNTRLADQQANDFIAKFQVIDQLSENPNGTTFRDNTGLSATLIQKRGTNEFTLSIRSTEYANND